MDWHAVEEAYLGNQPVPITHVDNFFTPKALAMLLDMARGTSIFVDSRYHRRHTPYIAWSSRSQGGGGGILPTLQCSVKLKAQDGRTGGGVEG